VHSTHDAIMDVLEMTDAVFVWRCPAPVSLTLAFPYPKVWEAALKELLLSEHGEKWELSSAPRVSVEEFEADLLRSSLL